jgi:hypothetical protein
MHVYLTFNQRVGGSIPTALTNKMKNLRNDPKVSELAPLYLGRVDEFDQAKAGGEADD